MSDSCEKCGLRCQEWYKEQIALMAKDENLPPMHCIIVCLVQSVNFIKENHGYAAAHTLAQRLAAQVEIGLELALNEKEVMQNR